MSRSNRWDHRVTCASGPRRSGALTAAAATLTLALAGSGACDSSTSHRASGSNRRASTTTTTTRARPANVYPSPGTLAASATTQVVFRGVAASSLDDLTVVGSSSGIHRGRLRSQADKKGTVFTPDAPFAEGESVTVTTKADLAGSTDGTFTFTIARQYHPLVPVILDVAPADTGVDRIQYVSTDATASKVTLSGAPSSQPVLLSPNAGDLSGLQIVDPSGEPIWTRPAPGGSTRVVNLARQTYRGRPVLTWFEGKVSVGYGLGTFVVADEHYREIARVKAANGYAADVHDLEITPSGTAFLISYNLVIGDLSVVGGSADRPVVDGVVQEVDIASGDLLFEWHSLGSIPFAESVQPVPTSSIQPFDYVHLNAAVPDDDGNVLVSARHTNTIYKIDRSTGTVRWRLGGSASTIDVAADARFFAQHDVHRVGPNEISLFDNGANNLTVQHPTRGIIVNLDESAEKATLVAQYPNPRQRVSNMEGSFRVLSGGNVFAGWGSAPGYTEFGRDGTVATDTDFAPGVTSYRAVSAPWVGRPADPPSVAARRTGAHELTVYASWNGATEVRSWDVLGGTDPTHLVPVASGPRTGFETAVRTTSDDAFVAVRALDASGRVMATSPTVAVP